MSTQKLRQLSEHLFVYEDTCNVYLVRDGDAGLLIDSGGGAVTEVLGDAGVRSLEWVLHTHFHRDQCWGSARLVKEHGMRVAVPEYERYFFASAREQWRTRRIFDNYSGRSVGMAPAEDIAVDAELYDYEQFRWRDIVFYVLPAKGHTLGSVALIAEIDGRRIAFTGDLLIAGGHIYQLHTLEYCFGDLAGVLYTLQSLRALCAQAPELILPSHGPVIEEVTKEIELLEGRLRDVVPLGPLAGAAGFGFAAPDPASLPEPELVQLSEHLLSSGPWACASFYVLLSGTGEALLIDYGQPHYVDLHGDRDQLPFESMRFIVHRLDQLRERFGVHTIEVVCATHAHDDHVCGIPYLQRHHGSECWALDMVADVLEQPAAFAYLPATFPKPIAVQRRLADGERISWRGFELTFHSTPGHAEAHSLISAEIDGQVVAFTGDSFFPNVAGDDGKPQWGHHTALSPGYRLGMGQRSADVLRTVAPDMICDGHGGGGIAFDGAMLEQIDDFVKRETAAFRALVAEPEDQFVDISWARLRPYTAVVAPGSTLRYTLTLRNHLGRQAAFTARLIPSADWSAPEDASTLTLDAGETGELVLPLTAANAVGQRRSVVTAEVLIDGRSQGPIAEALISVLRESERE